MATFSSLFFLFSLVLNLNSILVTSSSSSVAIIKGAYYPSWNVNLPPSEIDTYLFTHIFYAFLNPSNVTFKFELPNSTAILLSNFTTTLHYKNPPVKTLLSIGGASDEVSTLFTKIASSRSSRTVFINSSIEVARKFGFNGLDLDWEYPQTPKDMKNMGYLFKDLRVAIKNEAKTSNMPPLLLTAAVYFSADFSVTGGSQKYPVRSIKNNLDFINAMCYDYYGAWNTSLTGAHAGFFDPSSNINSLYGLKSWLDAGLPREKLVMGLPLYGRTWTLRDPNDHGIGAPGVAAGPGAGVLTLDEVETFNKNYTATIIYDSNTVSTYSFASTSWISYDDVVSSVVKIAYAQAFGLRGYFFWHSASRLNGNLHPKHQEHGLLMITEAGRLKTKVNWACSRQGQTNEFSFSSSEFFHHCVK